MSSWVIQKSLIQTNLSIEQAIMKNNLYMLIKIHAALWILTGALGLTLGLAALWQGRFEFPVFTIALFIGVGLLRHNRFAWQYAIITLFGYLAVEIFLFSLIITSVQYRYGDSVMPIAWGNTNVAVIPGPIFYPLGFCLLAGQICFLLSKPIRKIFLTKKQSNS